MKCCLLFLFFASKKEITTRFEPLFRGSGGGKPVSPTYTKFCRKWGWYKVIADLVENKILFFDEILKKTVVEIFRFLLYQLDKGHADDEQSSFMKQIGRY